MASTPQHYEKGKMEMSEHRATFESFWWWTKASLILIGITLVLMAYFLT